MSRHVNIHLTEHEGQTSVIVAGDGAVEFELSFKPKAFEDPEVATLRTIVENQRAEINRANAANGVLEQALKEAKMPKKPSRRRR